MLQDGDSKGYRGVRDLYPIDAQDRVTVSFSSTRKRMSTIVRDQKAGTLRLYCKGASEIVLGLCSNILMDDMTVKPLNDTAIASISKTIGDFADEGLRTLTVRTHSGCLLFLSHFCV